MRCLIRKAKESDLEQVHKLLQENVYYDMEYTKGYTLGMIKSIAYVAEINKEIIGFSNIVPMHNGVYESKYTATHKDYRRMGVGMKLMECKLATINSGTIVSTSWVSPKPENNSERLLVKLGFVEVASMPSYYATECKSVGFCSYNTDGSCRCGAKIFVKHKF
jgi:N-acetylglutamate synthase-like GNAT family acetyltransferase